MILVLDITLPGKEHALVLSNHRSDIDWLIGWVMAQVFVWNKISLNLGDNLLFFLIEYYLMKFNSVQVVLEAL